jgi:phosphoribosyl 1,2-cyclic phosphate phosphodiesterase
MQLTFLGTAASEGFPNAFCDCENCTAARQASGPSLRKRSSALINRDLLIDLGPDLMAAAQQHGVSLAQIAYCLQTHEHEDHLDPSHFGSRSQFCGVYGTPRLHYYASQGAFDKAARQLGRAQTVAGLLDEELADKLNLAPHVIEPFQRVQVGPYDVLSVKANHAAPLMTMLYVIGQGERTLFYGTDTSEMGEETWQALAEFGRPFNAVVLDHTFGFKGRSGGHMNAEQFLEQVARLRQENLLAADARIYATHIGHHSNPAHPMLEAYAQQNGYLVAYDGLVVEV